MSVRALQDNIAFLSFFPLLFLSEGWSGESEKGVKWFHSQPLDRYDKDRPFWPNYRWSSRDTTIHWYKNLHISEKRRTAILLIFFRKKSESVVNGHEMKPRWNYKSWCLSKNARMQGTWPIHEEKPFYRPHRIYLLRNTSAKQFRFHRSSPIMAEFKHACMCSAFSIHSARDHYSSDVLPA